jgi:hypothetical protein
VVVVGTFVVVAVVVVASGCRSPVVVGALSVVELAALGALALEPSSSMIALVINAPAAMETTSTRTDAMTRSAMFGLAGEGMRRR